MRCEHKILLSALLALPFSLSPSLVLAQDSQPVTESIEDKEEETPESVEPVEPSAPVVPATPPKPEKSATSAGPSEPAPDGGVIVDQHVAYAPESSSSVEVTWNTEQEEAEGEKYLWNLKIGGYIRAKFTDIQNDANNDLYGRNDGFIVASARLSIEGEMLEKLGFRLQLDGAVDQDLGGTRPLSQVDTRLKDALIWWMPITSARLSVGQFKAPFDVEESYSRVEQLFVLNSVASRGVSGTEGFAVDGLARDREAGIMLDAPVIRIGSEDGFGVRYALALTNGRPAALQANDNESFGSYGRLELSWGEIARLGGAAMLNTERLQPEEADFIDQDVFGWTGDLTLKYMGVTLIGSIAQTTTTVSSINIQPETQATGYQVSLAYQEPFFGFQPAFRFAYYDPTSNTSGQTEEPIFENDARTFYTIGLNYNPEYPVRLMLNYTITDEQNSVALDNNRFDALLQVVF